MEKIRIESSELTIEVNDSGEYITINPKDMAFYTKFAGLVSALESAKPQYTQLLAESAEKPVDDIHRYDAVFAFNNEVCANLCGEIDTVFGENTCRKVFGNIVPTLEAFAQFFDQIADILNRYSAVRLERLNKYIGKYTKNREIGTTPNNEVT